MAIYSFQHDYISLNKPGMNGEPLGKGRAAAGVRYITRKAAEYVRYVGFSPNRFIAQREMQAIEDAMPRKDARIVHTFIVAVPNELNAQQRRKLVNDYAWKMTDKGRAAAIFSLHADNPENVHLHIYFTDRSVNFVRDDAGKLLYAEVGPTVQKLTAKSKERIQAGLQPNATQALREMWRDVANSALEENGFEQRIDNRSLLEQGIARQAEKHRGPLGTVMQVEPDEIPHADAESTEETDMNWKFEEKLPESLQPIHLIRGALEVHNHLKYFDDLQDEQARLTVEAETANTAAESYKREAVEFERLYEKHRDTALLAADKLEPLTNPDGTYKGREFKIWKWEIATPVRKQAKHYAKLKHEHQSSAADARETADRHLKHAQELADRATRAINQAEVAKRTLDESIERYGGAESLKETKQMMHDTIAQNLRDISPEDVLAEYEAGNLAKGEAIHTLEMMGQEAYIDIIEQKEAQQEAEQYREAGGLEH